MLLKEATRSRWGSQARSRSTTRSSCPMIQRARCCCRGGCRQLPHVNRSYRTAIPVVAAALQAGRLGHSPVQHRGLPLLHRQIHTLMGSNPEKRSTSLEPSSRQQRQPINRKWTRSWRRRRRRRPRSCVTAVLHMLLRPRARSSRTRADTFHPLLKVYGIVTVGGLEAMELVVQLQRVPGRWIPLQHVHQRYLYACHQD